MHVHSEPRVHLEDGDSMIVRNVGILLRRHNAEDHDVNLHRFEIHVFLNTAVLYTDRVHSSWHRVLLSRLKVFLIFSVITGKCLYNASK